MYPLIHLSAREQRHGQEVPDAEVDCFDERPVGGFEHVEVLGTDEESNVARRLGEERVPRHQLALLRGAGNGDLLRLVLHARQSGLDERGDEVVIVDAGERELALVAGRGRDVFRRQPMHLAVLVDDGLRVLHVPAGALLPDDVGGVAEAGSPEHDGIQLGAVRRAPAS